MIGNRLCLHLSVLYNKLTWKFRKKSKVKSIDETLDYINKNHCSVSRYGDGEFTIVLGIDCMEYQLCNEKLRKRLKEIMQTPLDNHIICLPGIFGDLSFLKESSRKFNKGIIDGVGRKWLGLIPLEKVYYNSFFTHCYNMFLDKSNCSKWFEKNKKIWENQDILLIEGESSRLGVGNDLFLGARSVQRILGLAQNAFEKYDELYNSAIEWGEGRLILIALGMTATVLAYDLSKVGFWAIDIGHIDVEYEWFVFTWRYRKNCFKWKICK
jgi:glycosyltransferase family protein